MVSNRRVSDASHDGDSTRKAFPVLLAQESNGSPAHALDLAPVQRISAGRHVMTASDVLTLQRVVGNQAVQRLLAAGSRERPTVGLPLDSGGASGKSGLIQRATYKLALVPSRSETPSFDNPRRPNISITLQQGQKGASMDDMKTALGTNFIVGLARLQIVSVDSNRSVTRIPRGKHQLIITYAGREREIELIVADYNETTDAVRDEFQSAESSVAAEQARMDEEAQERAQAEQQEAHKRSARAYVDRYRRNLTHYTQITTSEFRLRHLTEDGGDDKAFAMQALRRTAARGIPVNSLIDMANGGKERLLKEMIDKMGKGITDKEILTTNENYRRIDVENSEASSPVSAPFQYSALFNPAKGYFEINHYQARV